MDVQGQQFPMTGEKAGGIDMRQIQLAVSILARFITARDAGNLERGFLRVSHF